MFGTTILDVNSFTGELLLAKTLADTTYTNSGKIQRDFIGKPEEKRELILKVYGKYSGTQSLTKALFAEKALEKMREDNKSHR